MTKKSLSRKKQELILKKKEEGFNSNTRNEKLPTYNALGDMNLRHYFENRKLQSHLFNTGMIDKSGRVLDIEKHKGKLAIIEQEFKQAEKSEIIKSKEEEEMRRRVQLKRHTVLNEARREEKIIKLKEEKKIRQEILQATRSYMGPELSGSASSTKIKRKSLT